MRQGNALMDMVYIVLGGIVGAVAAGIIGAHLLIGIIGGGLLVWVLLALVTQGPKSPPGYR